MKTIPFVQTTKKLCGCLCAITLLAGLSVTATANDYYRWVDGEGVTHYGATPPQGTNAVKVKTWGGTSTPVDDEPASTEPAAAAEDDLGVEENLPPEELERRRRVEEKQKEVCDTETKRLEVLNRPGRIRMKQPDGSYRYLTQSEIQQEIATTQQVIADACKPIE